MAQIKKMGERKIWRLCSLDFHLTGMFIYLVATDSSDDIKADFFRLPMSIENLAGLIVDIKTSFFGLVD